MTGYSKLFSDIVTSSIWSEDDKTRIVWITILALKDKDGFVPAAIPGLANAARVSIEECEAAVKKLESPDKYSRTTEYEGRRIRRVDGGWFVLNHLKFRDKLSGDKQAEQARERMRRMRERNKSVTLRNPVSVSGSESGSTLKGGCKGGKTFKQWNETDLIASVEAANADGILDDMQVKRFIDYWTEPMASGKPRLCSQRAWDTKRRLRTWADRNETNYQPKGDYGRKIERRIERDKGEFPENIKPRII